MESVIVNSIFFFALATIVITGDDPIIQTNDETLTFSGATEWCEKAGLHLYYPKSVDEKLPKFPTGEIPYWLDGKRPCGLHAKWKTQDGKLDGCLVLRVEKDSNAFYSTSCDKKYRALCLTFASKNVMSEESARGWCSRNGSERIQLDKQLSKNPDLVIEEDPVGPSINDDKSELYVTRTIPYPVDVLPDEENDKTFWVDDYKSCGKNFPWLNKKGEDISPSLVGKWKRNTGNTDACLFTKREDSSYIFSVDNNCETKRKALCSNGQATKQEVDFKTAVQACKKFESTLWYPTSSTDPVPVPKGVLKGIKKLNDKSLPEYWVDGKRKANQYEWSTHDGKDITEYVTYRLDFFNEPIVLIANHCARVVYRNGEPELEAQDCKWDDEDGGHAYCTNN